MWVITELAFKPGKSEMREVFGPFETFEEASDFRDRRGNWLAQQKRDHRSREYKSGWQYSHGIKKLEKDYWKELPTKKK